MKEIFCGPGNVSPQDSKGDRCGPSPRPSAHSLLSSSPGALVFPMDNQRERSAARGIYSLIRPQKRKKLPN